MDAAGDQELEVRNDEVLQEDDGLCVSASAVEDLQAHLDAGGLHVVVHACCKSLSQSLPLSHPSHENPRYRLALTIFRTHMELVSKYCGDTYQEFLKHANLAQVELRFGFVTTTAIL